jgi:hypothetical protein
MTVQNASTGYTYELVLEVGDGTWHGTWQTLDSGGQPVDEPRGTVAGSDAYEAFKACKRALEDIDLSVIDADWVFEEPLPPWMLE